MTRACAAAIWRTCDSPLGQFAVAAQAHALIAVVLPGRPRPQAVTELEDGEDRRRAEGLAARACAQLSEYFAGERTCFTLPTDLVLTRGPFAARVQRALGDSLRADPLLWRACRHVGQPEGRAGGGIGVRA